MPPRCKNPNAPAADDPGWLHYVEPYAGGLAVLLANDPEGISEVVNDKNYQLSNFWTVLCEPTLFAEFHRRAQATPFSESLYSAVSSSAKIIDVDDVSGDPAGCAWNFFIRCRQSLAGRMAGFAAITKNRTRRGMNEQISAWLHAIEGLPAVHARLKRVLILNRKALEVIKDQDGPRTLFYLDPPYLHETRATTKEYGEHEMTNDDHVDLMELLPKLKGRFLLSGYHSRLYDNTATLYRWHCHEMKINNHAAGGKTKRVMTECVWTNY